MANFLSAHALRRAPVATGDVAAVAVTQIFTYTVPTPAPGNADLIEIGYLPANNRLLSFEIISAGTGAATAEVGLMTGTQGDAADTSRVLTGNRILAAASVINGVTLAATRAACLAVAKADKDVGIGIRPSAALTAGGTITVVATYAGGI